MKKVGLIKLLFGIIFIACGVTFASLPNILSDSVEITPIEIEVYGEKNNGKLVYANGKTNSHSIEDQLFKTKVEGLLLTRVVEKYTKNDSSEKPFWEKVNKEYSENNKIVSPEIFKPKDLVSIGKYNLSRDLSEKILSKQLPISFPENVLEKLNIFAQNSFKLHNGTLYFGLDPKNPRINDFRVRLTYTPSTSLTILAMQDQQNLTSYNHNDVTIAEVLEGNHTIEEIKQKVFKENTEDFSLIIRIGGALITIIGLILTIVSFRKKDKYEDETYNGFDSNNSYLENDQLNNNFDQSTVNDLPEYNYSPNADKFPGNQTESNFDSELEVRKIPEATEEDMITPDVEENAKKHVVKNIADGLSLSTINQIESEEESEEEDERSFDHQEDVSFEKQGPQASIEQESVDEVQETNDVDGLEYTEEFSPFEEMSIDNDETEYEGHNEFSSNENQIVEETIETIIEDDTDEESNYEVKSAVNAVKDMVLADKLESYDSNEENIQLEEEKDEEEDNIVPEFDNEEIALPEEQDLESETTEEESDKEDEGINPEFDNEEIELPEEQDLEITEEENKINDKTSNMNNFVPPPPPPLPTMPPVSETDSNDGEESNDGEKTEEDTINEDENSSKVDSIVEPNKENESNSDSYNFPPPPLPKSIKKNINMPPPPPPPPPAPTKTSKATENKKKGALSEDDFSDFPEPDYSSDSTGFDLDIDLDKENNN